MKKVIIGAVLAILLPSMSLAAYDLEKIKANIHQAKKIFEVEKWTLSDDGQIWKAKSKLKEVTSLSVGKKHSGVVTMFLEKENIKAGIFRCIKMGNIGLTPKTEKEKNKIKYVVLAATQSRDIESLILNDVIFEANSFELGNTALLSCWLSPSKKVNL